MRIKVRLDLFDNSDPCSCTNVSGHHETITKLQPSATPTVTETTTTTTTTATTMTMTSKTSKRPTATSKVPIQLVSATTDHVPKTTTKQPISVRWRCGKLSTVESIAIQHHLDQTNATPCSLGNHAGSDEAFVLTNCNTPNPSDWKPGVKVLQHCSDIPTYTPVATFIGGAYHPSLAESGVFMGCLNGGFKLGVQHCNSTPTIDHVLTNSTGLENADYYYVIE